MLARTIRDIHHLKRVHHVIGDQSLSEKIRGTLQSLRLQPALLVMKQRHLLLLQQHTIAPSRHRTFPATAPRHGTTSPFASHALAPRGGATYRPGALPLNMAASSSLDMVSPAQVGQLLECLIYFELSHNRVTKEALKLARCILDEMNPSQLSITLTALAAAVGPNADFTTTKQGKLMSSTSKMVVEPPSASSSELHLKSDSKEEQDEVQYFQTMLHELLSLLVEGVRIAHSTAVPFYRQLSGPEMVQLFKAFSALHIKKKEVWTTVADYATQKLFDLDGNDTVELLQVFASENIHYCDHFFSELMQYITTQSYASMTEQQLEQVLHFYEELGQPSHLLRELLTGQPQSSTRNASLSVAASAARPRTPSPGASPATPSAGLASLSAVDRLTALIPQATTMELLELLARESERRTAAPPPLSADPILALRHNHPGGQRQNSSGLQLKCVMNEELMLLVLQRLAEILHFTPDLMEKVKRSRLLSQGGANGNGKPASNGEDPEGDASSRPPQLKPTIELSQHLLLLKSIVSFDSHPQWYRSCGELLAALLDAITDAALSPDAHRLASPPGTTSAAFPSRTFGERENNVLLFVARGVMNALPDVAEQPRYFLQQVVQHFSSTSDMRFVQRPAAQLELYTTALLTMEPYGGLAVLRHHLPVLTSVAAGATNISRSDQVAFLYRVARLAESTPNPEDKKVVHKSAESVFAALLASGGTRRWSKGLAPAECISILRAMMALKYVNEPAVNGVVQCMREETHRFKSTDIVELLYDLGRLGVKNLELYTAVAVHVLGLDSSTGGGVTLAVRPSGPGNRGHQAARQRLSTKDLCLLLFSFTFVLKGLVKVVQTVLARLKLCAAAADPHDISLALYSVVKLNVTRHLEVTRPLCHRAAQLLADPKANHFTPTELSSLWSSLRILRYRHEPLLEETMILLERPPDTWPHSWKSSDLRCTIAALIALSADPQLVYCTTAASAESPSTSSSGAFNSADLVVQRMQRFAGSPVVPVFRELSCRRTKTPLDAQQLYLVLTSLRHLVEHGCATPLTLVEYAQFAVQCEQLPTPFTSGRVGPSHSVEAAVEVLLALHSLRQEVHMPVVPPAPLDSSAVQVMYTWRRAAPSTSRVDSGSPAMATPAWTPIVPVKKSAATAERTKSKNSTELGTSSAKRSAVSVPPYPPKLWRFVCDNWGKIHFSSDPLREELRSSGVLSEFTAGQRSASGGAFSSRSSASRDDRSVIEIDAEDLLVDSADDLMLQELSEEDEGTSASVSSSPSRSRSTRGGKVATRTPPKKPAAAMRKPSTASTAARKTKPLSRKSTSKKK